MVIGDPLNSSNDPNPLRSMPVQIPMPWQDAVGNANVLDNASPIIDPDGQIDHETRHIYHVRRMGTTLRARAKFSGAAAVRTVSIEVFGRYSSTGEWERLINKDGDDRAIPVATIAGDVTYSIGGTAWTFGRPDPTAHAWDLNGCEQILIGTVTQSGNGSDIVQAKVI